MTVKMWPDLLEFTLLLLAANGNNFSRLFYRGDSKNEDTAMHKRQEN